MANPRNVLIFSEGGLAELREALLDASPLETAAFLLARPVRTPAGGWRLLVHDRVAVHDDEYRVRTPTMLELSPAVVARAVQRARRTRSALVLAHSHPLDRAPAPSARDRAGEGLLLPAVQRRVPDVPLARLIVGLGSVHAALLGADGEDLPLEVQDVGADLVLLSADNAGSAVDAARFDRQTRAFGHGGQALLGRLRVGIVGLGGTGSVIAQQLAHLGVGELLLIDPDELEESNLNRVVGSRPGDVGRAKVEIARHMIESIHPGAKVEALAADVRDVPTARRLLDVDVIVMCTDSHGSRAVLTQLAYQFLIPAVDVGVAVHANGGRVSHISGRVQMLAPGLPCLLCGGVLDPEAVRRDLLTEEAWRADPYIVGATTPQPAVISINSATSSLAVTMLLAAVTGMPVSARHQRLRLETGIVSRVVMEPQPGCPLCSEDGSVARGDTWPMPGRPA